MSSNCCHWKEKMDEAKFPIAKKIVRYTIVGNYYEKIGQREAINDPTAIRGMDGETLAWFKPSPIPQPATTPSQPERRDTAGIWNKETS